MSATGDYKGKPLRPWQQEALDKIKEGDVYMLARGLGKSEMLKRMAQKDSSIIFTDRGRSIDDKWIDEANKIRVIEIDKVNSNATERNYTIGCTGTPWRHGINQARLKYKRTEDIAKLFKHSPPSFDINYIEGVYDFFRQDASKAFEYINQIAK